MLLADDPGLAPGAESRPKAAAPSPGRPHGPAIFPHLSFAPGADGHCPINRPAHRPGSPRRGPSMVRLIARSARFPEARP